MNKNTLQQVTDSIVGAINHASQEAVPFFHLKLKDVFPPDLYAQLLQAMPSPCDYRMMSGRTKRSTRIYKDMSTRTKMDLLPEYIYHLPLEKRKYWALVSQTICSDKVQNAFIERFSNYLEVRHGACLKKRKSKPFYLVPTLVRDIPGYKVKIHTDTHWKAITIQIYLPPDNSISEVGTIFHARNPDQTFERITQMPFVPNSGYAFAVAKNTYHSVDEVGPDVRQRDSIMLTYFVDDTLLAKIRNRAKRFANFIANEFRCFGRTLGSFKEYFRR
jgi:hypothetical protein